MSNDELTFETGEASGIIPEGTNRAEITGVELDDSSGYEYIRVEVQTENDVEMSVSYPAPEDKLTLNHGLGEAVERFGHEVKSGGQVNLAEAFSTGREVEFEAFENENGYMDIDPSSFRPAGQSKPEGSEEPSETEDVELSDQLRGVLDGQEGNDKNAVIGSIAGELGGEFVEEFNNAIEAGAVSVDGNGNFQGI